MPDNPHVNNKLIYVACLNPEQFQMKLLHVDVECRYIDDGTCVYWTIENFWKYVELVHL